MLEKPYTYKIFVFGAVSQLGATVQAKKISLNPTPDSFLFWFLMVVLLSICLLSASIVATCIAAHLARSCFMIKKKSENR